MGRVGKKYRKAREAVAAKPTYPLPEAVAAVTQAAFAKFDETVEVAMRLGVDPKHADQMVRGTVVLPHGLGGKSKRVLVVASGEKLKEAQEAGADFVGGDDMVAKIQEGLAGLRRGGGDPGHDEVRRPAGQGAGPPRPHAEPQDGHGDLRGRPRRSGRSRRARWSSASTRRRSSTRRSARSRSSAEKLLENAKTLIDSVIKAKPAAAKGKYVKSSRCRPPWAPACESDLASVEGHA